MRNVVRFNHVDDLGRRAVGYRSHGPIDYLMAEVYDYVAMRLFEAEVLVREIGQETYVRLEDYVDFERSTLLDPDPPYHPGPAEREYGEPQSWGDDDTSYWNDNYWIDTNERP